MTPSQFAELTSPCEKDSWWSGAMVTTWAYSFSPKLSAPAGLCSGMQDFTHQLGRTQQLRKIIHTQDGVHLAACIILFIFFPQKIFVVNLFSVFVYCLSCTHSLRRWIWHGGALICAVQLLVTAGISVGLWHIGSGLSREEKKLPRLEAKNISAM